MKKTIAILIAALMLLSMIPVNVFAAADDCKVVGEHTKANCAAYTKVETVDPVDCKFGYTLYSCDACGVVFADDFQQNENGHVWETKAAAQAATCVSPAKKEEQVCKVCGITHPELNGGDVEGSEALGGSTHADNELVWGEIEDCTTDKRVGTCPKCGWTTEKPVDTHSYNQYPDSYVAPTCTEKGSATFKCTKCAHTKTLAIDALGHDTKDIPANGFESCEKPGNTAGEICTRCNTYITKPEQVGHSGKCDWKFVSFVVGEEPTCTTDGKAIYECTANGNAAHYKTDVAAARHTYELEPEVIEATCTTWGFKLYYCIECGDLKPFEEGDKIAPLGHKAFDKVAQAWTDGADTCEKDGVLTKYWYCDRVCDGATCGALLEEKVDNYKAHAVKTVVVDPYCHQVGFTVTYCTNPDCILPTTTSIDGLDLTVVDENGLQLIPSYKEDSSLIHAGVYAVGTTKDANRHDLETQIINDSTCTVKGAKYDYCPYCSYVGDVEEIGLKAHKYPETRDDLITSPICGVNDKEIYYCDTCGIDANKKVVEIPNSADNAAHKFSIEVAAKAPQCKESGETGYTAHKLCEYCYTKSDDYKFLDHVAHNFVTKVTVPQCDGTKGKTWEECEWCPAQNDKFTVKEEAYVYEATKTYATFADAQKVHAGLDINSKDDVRDGDCYKTALESYKCNDCGKNVLVIGANANYGSHQYITDKNNAAYDTYHDDAVAPTCQNVGYTELFICIVCGYKNGGAEVKKVDHEMVDYECGEGQYCKYHWDKCTEVKGSGAEKHSFVVDYIANANCVKIGYTHKYCENCKDETVEYLTNFFAPNGHSLEDVDEKAPTCVKPGNTAGKDCKDCDYKTWTDVAATGAHKNAAGTTFYDKCTDKTEDRYCTVCKDTIAQSHTMVPGKIVEADCNNEGYKLEGCVDCGFKKMTDFKPKKEHTYVEINRVDATILETGLVTYQCSVCKAEGIEQFTTEVLPVIAQIGIVLDATNANGQGDVYTDSSLVKVVVTLDSAKLNAWGVAFDLFYSENLQFVKAEFSANNKFVANPAVVDNNVDPAKGTNPADYVSISAFAPNGEDKKLANVELEGKMEFVTLYFKVVNGEIAKGTAVATFDVANSEVLDIAGDSKNVDDGDAAIEIVKFMDYNADGDVTLQDVLAASKILSGELTVKNDKNEDVLVTYDVALDVDKDGEITADDLLNILAYINGAKTYADVTKA